MNCMHLQPPHYGQLKQEPCRTQIPGLTASQSRPSLDLAWSFFNVFSCVAKWDLSACIHFGPLLQRYTDSSGASSKQCMENASHKELGHW